MLTVQSFTQIHKWWMCSNAFLWSPNLYSHGVSDFIHAYCISGQRNQFQILEIQQSIKRLRSRRSATFVFQKCLKWSEIKYSEISRTTAQLGYYLYENGRTWPGGVLTGTKPFGDSDHFWFHGWKTLKRKFEIKLSQKCWTWILWTIFEVQSDLRFQRTRVWG